ncbi:hypothetical protein [Paraburkholderia adhaesiva]|uniref:hypothetical protein n=1 Tax=Paraburkholderia adhaesiva TaxID=2883244 RepID=UPI001F203C9C|nr:hypothetical protein [Paraburkholderia adhaesiva]
MWSRKPPVNRNVDRYEWEQAERMHATYKRLHEKLQRLGMDAHGADAYLDAYKQLERTVELLNPTEEDFFWDDHTSSFAIALQSLQKMQALWSKARDGNGTAAI